MLAYFIKLIQLGRKRNESQKICNKSHKLPSLTSFFKAVTDTVMFIFTSSLLCHIATKLVQRAMASSRSTRNPSPDTLCEAPQLSSPFQRGLSSAGSHSRQRTSEVNFSLQLQKFSFLPFSLTLQGLIRL